MESYNAIKTALELKRYWVDEFEISLDGKDYINGLMVNDHCGISTLRALMPDSLKVYGLRHGDDWGVPSAVEDNDVVVNFFGYFITDKDLTAYMEKDNSGNLWAEVEDYGYIA